MLCNEQLVALAIGVYVCFLSAILCSWHTSCQKKKVSVDHVPLYLDI